VRNNLLTVNSKESIIAPILGNSLKKVMMIYLNDTYFRDNLLHTFSDDAVSYYDSSCVFLI